MAFSALEALQAFGMGRQMQQQERQLARQEALAARQETGRVRVGEQIRAGDFVGAAGTAFDSGLGDEIPNIQHLDRAQQGQLQRETTAALAAIDALERIPDDAQRTAFAQTLIGPLRQAGFDDNELAEQMRDLSLPSLQARRAYLQRIAAGMGTQGRGGQPTTMQRNYEWLSGINPQLGQQFLTRQTSLTPRPVTDPTTGQMFWVYPDTGGGGPQQGGPPETLTIEQMEELEQGGAGQGAPTTFSDEWQPIDGSAYPPGQW